MTRIFIKPAITIITFLFIACGATPGIENTDKENTKNQPIYTYKDSKGNTYNITTQKLEFIPISENNTIDSLDDQGLYTDMQITQNDYNKIAAVLEKELSRKQIPNPNRNPNLPTPSLLKQIEKTREDKILDLNGVQAINYVIEPFLENQ